MRAKRRARRAFALMPIFPKPYADLVQKLRVPIGIVVAAGFGWFAHPSPMSLLAGLPLAAAGLVLRGWAAGHLRKNQKLTTSGPYAWVRNPLYVGTLVAAGGCLIAAAQPVLAWVTLVAFLLIYTPVVEQEEQHLRKLFPEYEEYARRVPQFVPRLPRDGSEQLFSYAIYQQNKEYKALWGLLWAYAFLILKAYFASR
jgi:protein-S-isoprenylcysteine O-methyltransferase Ste14